MTQACTILRSAAVSPLRIELLGMKAYLARLADHKLHGAGAAGEHRRRHRHLLAAGVGLAENVVLQPS